MEEHISYCSINRELDFRAILPTATTRRITKRKSSTDQIIGLEFESANSKEKLLNATNKILVIAIIAPFQWIVMKVCTAKTCKIMTGNLKSMSNFGLSN